MAIVFVFIYMVGTSALPKSEPKHKRRPAAKQAPTNILDLDDSGYPLTGGTNK